MRIPIMGVATLQIRSHRSGGHYCCGDISVQRNIFSTNVTFLI